MKILTDVDSFDADVTVPQDSDVRNAASVESAFQKLANRTRNSKNRIDKLATYADYRISGTKTSAQIFDLTLRQQSGGFSLASNIVTLPAAGVYDVSMMCKMWSDDATNPLLIQATLLKAGIAIEACGNTRFSATAADIVEGMVRALVTITDPVTDTLLVKSNTTNTTMSSESRLVIRRVA